MSHTESIRNVKKASVLKPRSNEHAIWHYDADFAPCDCYTHDFHCKAISVAVSFGKRRAYHRCLNCGTKWTRLIPSLGNNTKWARLIQQRFLTQ